jgi:hypothetical protein
MLSVNALIQEAAELCSMVADGEPADGTLAASYLNLLNRTIAKLNNDNYFSSCLDTAEVNAAGEIQFKVLEENELVPDNVTVINMEPPEAIVGVSRKVGIRWLELYGSNPQAMAAVTSMTLPSHYCYQVTTDTTPHDHTPNNRLVGKLTLNGSGRADIKVYFNRRIPVLKLTDAIPLSPLYHDAILYSLAEAACLKYKLFDYLGEIRDLKNSALAMIDRNTLNNRMMENGTRLASSWDRAYYDGLAGDGLAIE